MIQEWPLVEGSRVIVVIEYHTYDRESIGRPPVSALAKRAFMEHNLTVKRFEEAFAHIDNEGSVNVIFGLRDFLSIG